MTSRFVKSALISVATSAVFAVGVQAADMEKPVKARQSVMTLYSFYMGQLGGMAKGNIEYDAKTAQGAAEALHALATMDTGKMWAPGSSRADIGEMTRAKAEIWTTYPEIGKKAQDLTMALDGLVKVAGSGLDGLKGGIGPVGKACGGCHKEFRHKNN
jgi:cytochrome c556